MAQGRPWQGHPKTGSEEKTQPPTVVGDALGWTPGTRFPAPPAAALTSSSPWGSSLCVSSLTHYISCSHRNQLCDYFTRTFVPSFQPGQFSLDNIKGEP